METKRRSSGRGEEEVLAAAVPVDVETSFMASCVRSSRCVNRFSFDRKLGTRMNTRIQEFTQVCNFSFFFYRIRSSDHPISFVLKSLHSPLQLSRRTALRGHVDPATARNTHNRTPYTNTLLLAGQPRGSTLHRWTMLCSHVCTLTLSPSPVLPTFLVTISRALRPV